MTTVELPEGETIERGREDLEANVLPMIKQAPGFVSAVFAPSGREGLSMVVFETREQAQAASDNMKLPPGVRMVKSDVREVAATA
ncbi:MAG: hypothetical protein JF887_09090 [Candidatus Dormibacteraeota bacterium]|uniref:Uncharacterized protein n=1 Tax=Candidatus Amunia macphersoniae TaxID=3127014 RepID=A0A934KP28_9BACT|nr:hypothetical protein [Candidatus Dormibacteraeota bacterium]